MKKVKINDIANPEIKEEKDGVKFLWTIPAKDLPALKKALAFFESENPGTIRSIRVSPPVKVPAKDRLN